jgi:hypothetical protein
MDDGLLQQPHVLIPPATVSLQGTGKMGAVVGEDWTPQTLPSWLHSIWVGIVDPWIVVFKGPRIWYKTVGVAHVDDDGGVWSHGCNVTIHLHP